jgi:hypothetical protein
VGVRDSSLVLRNFVIFVIGDLLEVSSSRRPLWRPGAAVTQTIMMVSPSWR